MSRASRKKEKKILQTLLSVTLLTVVAVLAILAAKHFSQDPSQEVQGNTDTQTITISSGSTSDTASDGSASVTDTSPQSTDTSSTKTQSATTDKTTDKTSNKLTDNTTHTNDSVGLDENAGINPDGSFDFSSWNLILLNPDNPLPENYKVQLKTINLNGKSRQVDVRCADAFVAMVTAAKNDGITLYLRSTYRGIQLQTDSFNARVQQYINQGYSREDAIAKTATIIAVPGTSEHHSGLAADITTPSYDRLDSGFENTDAFRWLKEHCAEYGFILRYPKEKTDITKIIYEPWHYRYVGKQAAQIIMSEGICYEEFVAKYGNQ